MTSKGKWSEKLRTMGVDETVYCVWQLCGTILKLRDSLMGFRRIRKRSGDLWWSYHYCETVVLRIHRVHYARHKITIQRCLNTENLFIYSSQTKPIKTSQKTFKFTCKIVDIDLCKHLCIAAASFIAKAIQVFRTKRWIRCCHTVSSFHAVNTK